MSYRLKIICIMHHYLRGFQQNIREEFKVWGNSLQETKERIDRESDSS